MKESIKYSVEKSKTSNEWVVWKNVTRNKSIASFKIYADKLKIKCEDFKNQLEKLVENEKRY